MAQIGAELAGADPATLSAAVNAVMAAHHDSLARGARETASVEDRLTAAAVYFHTLLELGYLVASADGFAATERAALAQLIETATDAALDRTVLLAHFDDLDSGTDILGRRERLARAAANLDDTHARRDALSFAALVAIADGRMAHAELECLVEIGGHFELARAEVEAVVDAVVAQLTQRLEGVR